MSRRSDDIVYFSGQVELSQPTQSLLADELTLNNATEQTMASGNVVFESPGYQLQTEFMTMNQRDLSAYFESSSFTLPEQHIRGTATEVIQFDSSISQYKNVQYTTCDPGDSTWHLTANQLDINRESGLGTALHAVIYIQDLPVFYLPYFQFPIDDRRMSGILPPTIVLATNGIDTLSVPVYWNIAANLDATITPIWYRDRGTQLNTENRYLFKNHAGQINLSYIDDDEENERRSFKKWLHQADLGSNVTADIAWRGVSDSTFFDDFESIGDISDNVDSLERHAILNHSAELWQSSLLLQTFQTPDSNFAIADRPYRRLPRLAVDSRFRTFDNGIQFNSSNEWVRFDHESDSKIIGDRTHLVPYLSWDQSDSWYFFKPKLEYAVSDYQLGNNSLDVNSIQREIPILSLDTGLFFDRDMNIGTNLTQTLEPRLYFLRTPYEDQSNIPIFDSAVLSNTYDNLFQSNRFSGSDRIGDANQMTLGIGTRIFDNDSGAELLYSRIGQIFYNDDRLVQISGNIPDTLPKSNIISETTINPSTNLAINTKLVYKQTTKRVSEKTLSAYYQYGAFTTNLEYFLDETPDATTLNVGAVSRKTLLEQGTISMTYSINPRWTVLAKYSRSILLGEPLEHLLGVNYESCCWGIKIIASQTSNDIFTEEENAVFFEFTLKGLTKIYSKVRNVVPNTDPNF